MSRNLQLWLVQEELNKYMIDSTRYVLAVSGGVDSMVLAHAALERFSSENLLICHIEHGIRGEEALRDAELVKEFCRLKHANFVCCHVDVPNYAKEHHLSIEEAARKLRYSELRKQCLAFGAKFIVTAHQADDQAETVLWKLLRGTGSEGISGMRRLSEQKGFSILRPLLNISRASLEKYAELCKLRYCEDSTNADIKYTRNRIRKELLPYLEQNFNPAIKKVLLREAELFTEQEECLQSFAKKYLQDNNFCGIVNNKVEQFWISGPKLAVLPVALRRLILRNIYFQLGAKELSNERTLALDSLCLAAIGGKLVQLPDGVRALYRNKKIYFFKEN